MLSEVDVILDLIEDMRRKLNATAHNKRLSDPTVVALSEELDSLLNYYHAMTNMYDLAGK